MNAAPEAKPETEVASPSFEFDSLREAGNYRHALLREFGEALVGNVLEVGAGIGQMTALLRELPGIEELAVVEPEPAFCDQLGRTFPDLTIVQGTVEAVPVGTSWNVILSINVLEHIQEDEKELVSYRQKLAGERGALCLFVPARPEIYAPIDKDFGHYRRYTKAELSSKLHHAGFEIQSLRYFNLVGYFAWWLSFCVLKKRGFHPGAVRWFDRYVFPLVYGFESNVIAPFIGQSLIAVARARSLSS